MLPQPVFISENAAFLFTFVNFIKGMSLLIFYHMWILKLPFPVQGALPIGLMNLFLKIY